MSSYYAGFIIYGLVDPRTGLVRYIGQSRRGMSRPSTHICPSNLRKDHTRKGSWLRSLQKNGLLPAVLVLEEVSCLRELDAAEVRWIKKGRDEGWRLTNHADGGRGAPGHVVSQEARDRISRANKGHKITAEQRARQSASLRGRKFTAEHTKKISDARKGKPFSEEHKQHLREARRGRVVTAETRAKLSVAGRGRLVSEETRRKLAEVNMGRRWAHTEETKAKMSATRRGKPHSEAHKAAIAAAILRRNSSRVDSESLVMYPDGASPTS